MKDTPSLYDTLVQVLRQHEKWLDVRHAKTLAWMIVGLIESSMIGLTAWEPYVQIERSMRRVQCVVFSAG